MSNLGSRLEAALNFLSKIQDNNLFADIGSDHAFLAIEALNRGFAKSAVASDINRLPLEKGRENAENKGVKIEFILSDGFDNLEDKTLTSAAICGMGGELIAKILSRSSIAKKCHLILQPMSAQDDLRKALWDNGFEIETERFVIDGGKPYTVMKVLYTGKCGSYSYLDLYLGKERRDSEAFSEYCKKVLSAAKNRRLGIAATEKCTEEIDGLIEESQMHITNF